MTALDPGDFAHDDEQRHADDDGPVPRQPPTVHQLDVAVDATIIAADTLNEALLALDPDVPWELAASMLARVTHARKLLHQLEASFERHIGEHGPYGDTELEGVGYLSVHRRKGRKQWRHDDWKRDVRRAVLDRRDVAGESLVNPETGEEVNVYELIADAQDVHGATAPKLTALKALGLDGDDYCYTESGSLDVKIDTAAGATDVDRD